MNNEEIVIKARELAIMKLLLLSDNERKLLAATDGETLPLSLDGLDKTIDALANIELDIIKSSIKKVNKVEN